MVGAVVGLGLTLSAAPSAHADIEDLLQPIVDALGAGDPLAPAAAAAVAPSSADVPLLVSDGTEPVVDLSVGGGPSIAALVDTGSTGLLVPWYDIGLQDIGLPTGLGVATYSSGLDALYVTLGSTVGFTTTGGAELATGQTPVDVELFAWSTNPLAPTTLEDFFGVDSILGIGPNAGGPGPSSVITALPGDLGDGVLIDQPDQLLQFGPDPLTGGAAVAGAPVAHLEVSLNGEPPQPVTGFIDSGGVYGTLPSALFGGTNVGDVLKPGTQIAVFSGDGQPLYSYTVGTDASGTSTSPVVSSDSSMNTGNIPFQQQPVYISNSPAGVGTTIFDGTS